MVEKVCLGIFFVCGSQLRSYQCGKFIRSWVVNIISGRVAFDFNIEMWPAQTFTSNSGEKLAEQGLVCGDGLLIREIRMALDSAIELCDTIIGHLIQAIGKAFDSSVGHFTDGLIEPRFVGNDELVILGNA